MPIPPVAGVIDRVARFVEALRHEARDPLVVFDEQQFHAAFSSAGGASTGSSSAWRLRNRALSRSRYR